MYGQKARLLLNHDTVFLAELLMWRQGEPQWGPEHRSFNCMSMPKAHPEALQFVATVTVALAHFQIEDKIADSGARAWKAVRRFFSLPYRRAESWLRASGFAVDEMAALLASQRARETRAVSLDDVAEPTARATEMIFSHAAAEFGSMGRRFGRLVYILDAWEDRARDAKSGHFNALAAFPEIDGRGELLALTASLESDLPAHLAARLRINVEERLGMRPRVMHAACRSSSVRERWRSAMAFARSMKQREHAGFWKGAAVLATVPVLAFFVPHLVRSAESWRQCLGLAFNLMAVGAVFATVPIAPGGPEKKSGCWSSCGSGGCDACDCGDCCCECGECGSCCDC